MVFFRLLSYLPFRVLYILSDLLFLVIRYGFSYRLSVVRENLANAFPEKTPQEINRIVRQFYRNLSDLILESVKLLTINGEELNKRIYVHNPEVIEQIFNRKQSMLLVACHQFNWEWMVTAGRTHFNRAFTSVYRPLHQQFFDQLMVAVRTRFRGKLIANTALIDELKTHTEPTAFSMVMDHVSNKYHYWTTFLNQDTVFDTSIDFHAKSSQLPVVYPRLRRVKRGFYEVQLIPLGEPPYDDEPGLVKKFIAEIEQNIIQQPETYLWTHRRWKYQRPPKD